MVARILAAALMLSAVCATVVVAQPVERPSTKFRWQIDRTGAGGTYRWTTLGAGDRWIIEVRPNARRAFTPKLLKWPPIHESGMRDHRNNRRRPAKLRFGDPGPHFTFDEAERELYTERLERWKETRRGAIRPRKG